MIILGRLGMAFNSQVLRFHCPLYWHK